MEVNYFLDETWYLGYANITGAKDDVLELWIVHEDNEDFEVSISLTDIEANHRFFEMSGDPAYHAQIQEAFSGNFWCWVEELSVLVRQTYEIEAARAIHRKADMWDRLQAIAGLPSVIPTPDEIADLEDAGLLTELDDTIMVFHMQGCGKEVKRFAELLLKHSASMERIEAIHAAPTLVRYHNSESFASP